jgi:hypothetical protein
MTASILLAGALLAQAVSPAITVQPGAQASGEHMDVGYLELVAGQPEAAIARIQANHELGSDDPMVLINQGAAYAMMGKTSEARERLSAAILSSERYDVELADGRWMDSRRAARIAISRLGSSQVLAVR